MLLIVLILSRIVRSGSSFFSLVWITAILVSVTVASLLQRATTPLCLGSEFCLCGVSGPPFQFVYLFLCRYST